MAGNAFSTTILIAKLVACTVPELHEGDVKTDPAGLHKLLIGRLI